MTRISIETSNVLRALRGRGKSIPEISRETGVPKSTVLRHVRDVKIEKEYIQRLKEKQGGAKDRAAGLRENIFKDTMEIMSDISERDRLLILVGLYWGEGTKKDFAVINSDPFLIQAFISCLYSFGIDKSRICVSLRVHDDISIPEAKAFWAIKTGIPEEKINQVEIIAQGKKKGKLAYGMCRVRVKQGIKERLFIQGIISIIGKDSNERVVSS